MTVFLDTGDCRAVTQEKGVASKVNPAAAQLTPWGEHPGCVQGGERWEKAGCFPVDLIKLGVGGGLEFAGQKGEGFTDNDRQGEGRERGKGKTRRSVP